MFKTLSLAVLALCVSFTPASAKPKPKPKPVKAALLAGSYDGISIITNTNGDDIFYSPVRLEVARNGKITGTAKRDTPEQILSVNGQITKVTTRFRYLVTGVASGTFSDGTTWRGNFTANKLVDGKSFSGSAFFGDYRGSLNATDR